MAASLLKSSDTSNLLLVREYHFLEESLGFDGFTSGVLCGDYKKNVEEFNLGSRLEMVG